MHPHLQPARNNQAQLQKVSSNIQVRSVPYNYGYNPEIYVGDEILQGVSALKPTSSYQFSLKYTSEGASSAFSNEVSVTMPESGKQS